MFKQLLKSIGLAAFLLLLSTGSRAQGFAYLPALTPWRLMWEDTNRPDVPLSFDLFYGTEKIATLAATDVKLESTVNGTRTFSALVPGVLAGSTKITLVAVDPIGDRSDPSLPLTGDGLGKPSAPQNLAKQ